MSHFSLVLIVNYLLSLIKQKTVKNYYSILQMPLFLIILEVGESLTIFCLIFTPFFIIIIFLQESLFLCFELTKAFRFVVNYRQYTILAKCIFLYSSGHFVPTQAPQRKVYIEFLEQFLNKA